MERFLQVVAFTALVLIGISALLSIRGHYMVWKYGPLQERLRRPPAAQA